MEVGDAAGARDVEMCSCYAAALRNNRELCKADNENEGSRAKRRGRERKERSVHEAPRG